jgi:AhpD family alkylhydroperoxidase
MLSHPAARRAFVATCLGLSLTIATSHGQSGERAALVPLDLLAQQARERVRAVPRVDLPAPSVESVRDIVGLEPITPDRVPNYLLALAPLPQSVGPFAAALKSLLYDGAVRPEVKMAMGLRIAQINGSPYTAVHLRRMLNATPRGEALTRAAAGGIHELEGADRLALRYADSLTRAIHGVTDEDFSAVRGHFNDGQIVELTLTVCFFNYFTRLVEALHLPVEPWVFDTRYAPPAAAYEAPAARVNLISDRQLEWASTVSARRQSGNQPGTGFGLVNSQRAMMLSPAIASAWRAYTGSTGTNAVVDRELKLHVSFAVSEANGCRYCTLHQVQGLRRLGVSMEKLMQMKKDDSALTPRELTAVQFARTLTRTPSAVTDADYRRLVDVFGKQGALEVALQTCNFAFMNRFTDGLRLPSEDEAVKVYREVYGKDFERSSQK